MNAYVKDIEKDEIRSGCLVTTDRKKIWQKQLELYLEIDRICKKHNIPYFIIYGTLIGAARHKGFIPWDDDMDVGMMRPDYMRFIKVAPQEIKTPYFLQNVYSDNLIINWSKLRDSTSSSIEDWDDFHMNQGLFVDIFPFDAVRDGTERATTIDEMCKELWMSVIAPQQVEDGLKKGLVTHVASKVLERIIGMHIHDRMNIYEDFCLNHFDDSSRVCFQMSYWCNRSKPLAKSWFSVLQEMDFEDLKVPVPQGYDNILTELYGNWRQPKHEATPHDGLFQSADIPYDVMLKNINRELLKCGDYLWKR